MQLFMFDVPAKCGFDLLPITLRFIQDGRSAGELGERIGQDVRHGYFLFQNVQILGFAAGKSGNLHLTNEGRAFLSASEERRAIILAGAVLNSRVVSAILHHCQSITDVQELTVDDIAEFIQTLTVVSVTKREQVKESTARRRAASVKRWLDWTMENTPEGFLKREIQRIVDNKDI